MISIYVKKFEVNWFGVACDSEKIFATTFASNRLHVLHNLLRKIPFDVPFQCSQEFSTFSEQALAALDDIYCGKSVSCKFSLSTDHLSNYANKVLKVVSSVPIGYVTSYGYVARSVGGSPRAVGRVMALNPFPLIIPCHRIVNSDFSLGGYGFGSQIKLEILSRESRGHNIERDFSIDGEKLHVFPVEIVLSRRERKDSKRK